ncbi:GntR family transcriptional regulator [Clostridium sp. AF19-22AC]|uniref:GntR family transcriptional regulator n=1 Tax=Clostridia TaxID=186801 RepID=UPI000E486F26|nr:MULTISPECIES: GntR family transcriptional regulator [Clostridia]RHR31221.1 GntR family transcriptional regulator [Clostridium sp. AF19-22AC]
MDELNLYNIAYKHLYNCILFGLYPTGSSLPTVPDLCKTFNVSSATIHNALRLLEEENYVSLSQGRSAIVTYDIKEEECRTEYRAYSYATKDALLDLCNTMLLIWPEVMLQGLKLCDKEDLKKLTEIFERMSPYNEYPFFDFFLHILKALGNPLFLNLYMSTNFFGHPTIMHLGDNAYTYGYMTYLKKVTAQILSLRKASDYVQLKDLLTRLYQKHIKGVRLYYDTLPVPENPAKPIPYEWNYFSERPLVSFNLAMKLLRQIYSSLGNQEFLPSFTALAKQYSMPLITVRRAVKILSDIGIVETIPGKGTRVLVGFDNPAPISKLSTPNLKKALLQYLQSMQIILIICKDAARSVFPTLADTSIQSTISWLKNIQMSKDYYMTFGICFVLLKENAQSPALRQILGGLMYFQYLGYPLNDMKPYDFRFDSRSTITLLKSLEERDSELFATELQHLALDIFKAGKEKLIAGGIHEADAIMLPTFD